MAFARDRRRRFDDVHFLALKVAPPERAVEGRPFGTHDACDVDVVLGVVVLLVVLLSGAGAVAVGAGLCRGAVAPETRGFLGGAGFPPEWYGKGGGRRG